MTQKITNKTLPTDFHVDDFLSTISEKRKIEAERLIQLMQSISGQKPSMWGPSIIGFGQKHYKYDTGREGDVPQLGFSPRKKAITIYFSEGFEAYDEDLAKLGKYKNSVSCLYITDLSDINFDVLGSMLKKSYLTTDELIKKPATVEAYIASIPRATRATFGELRGLVKTQIPQADEVISYGIVGYKIDNKRARVYISGWKDHVAMYPIPHDEVLATKLKPFIKGQGTLWFSIDKPLPVDAIRETVDYLTK